MRTREPASEPRRLTDEQQETALAPDAALGSLFVSSPARRVHTSAASETAFVTGLLAIATVPFSATLGLAAILAVGALLTSILGLARSSRPAVAGSLLAAVGLVLALTDSGDRRTRLPRHRHRLRRPVDQQPPRLAGLPERPPAHPLNASTPPTGHSSVACTPPTGHSWSPVRRRPGTRGRLYAADRHVVALPRRPGTRGRLYTADRAVVDVGTPPTGQKCAIVVRASRPFRQQRACECPVSALRSNHECPVSALRATTSARSAPSEQPRVPGQRPPSNHECPVSALRATTSARSAGLVLRGRRRESRGGRSAWSGPGRAGRGPCRPCRRTCPRCAARSAC